MLTIAKTYLPLFNSPKPSLQVTFIRGMTRAPRFTFALCAPSSIYGRFKGAALRLARRVPLVSAFLICSVLTGTVAAIVWVYYGQDTKYAYRQIPLTANGVSGSDCWPRSYLS